MNVYTSYTTIINSTGTSNTGPGIRFVQSSNNQITNSNGTSNSNYGIYDNQASNNNQIINTTASSNLSSAIYIDGGSNVTVDCQGKSIIGTNTTGTYGIYSSQFNTTVKNCNINSFGFGVGFVNATYGTIDNTIISTAFKTCITSVV